MRDRWGYTRRVAWLAVTHPLEFWDRLQGRMELRRWPIAPDPAPGPPGEWQAELHRQLGAPWPCPDMLRYEGVYSAMVANLGVGTGHDSDPNLALVMACCTRHLKAERVVEVGVARGVSTRLALEALDDNGGGRLWSIDLPYQIADYQGQVGLAVPERLRPSWQFVRGSSQRRLPGLLRRVGPIQVFMRDTLPTPPTVKRELECAWRHMQPGAVAIAQDVHKSAGFDEFVAAAKPAAVMKVPLRTKGGFVGVAWK